MVRPPVVEDSYIVDTIDSYVHDLVHRRRDGSTRIVWQFADKF